MDNIDIAGEWFKVAAADLAAAQHLCTMHPAPREIICYHCQQCAVKYLKGFLARHGQPIDRTHDLTRLAAQCAAIAPVFAEVQQDCLMLTDYGTSMRYPFPLEISADDMQQALARAQHLSIFVTAQTSL